MRKASTLVMFDVDGTLTRTDQIDGECYVRALSDIFGFEGIATEWSTYAHSTDSGILDELCRSRLGRGPSDREAVDFRTRFVERLAEAAEICPFQPIAGAPEFVATLSAMPDCRVSLATGAWRDSATLKLASAGFGFDDYPSATADDGVERAVIMSLSRRRAEVANGGEFRTIIYIGDGIWDARACRALRMPLIGIGEVEQADRLSAEGAFVTFTDFSDSGAVMKALDLLASRQP